MNPSCAMRRVCGWLAGLFLLGGSGCFTVGPDYERPETRMPDAWNQVATEGLGSGASPVVAWWDLFGDPGLSILILDAAEANRDLKAVAARLEQAQAQYGVARSQFWPTVSGVGFAGATRASEDTVPVIPESLEREGQLYQLGGEFAWELDLWGRVRRIVESSRASYEAVEEAYRDALVVLFSQVTLTYIDARTLQQQILKLEENVGMLGETLEIVRNRNLAGLVPDLNVAQAERDLAVAEAALPTLRAAWFASVNRLGVLTGRLPSALHEMLSEPRPIPRTPDQVEVGLPAELLRQRPDIRRRERELAAQSARIGVARAEFYPLFALPGTFVLEAADAGNLFSGGSLAYRFGPAFRWNLFSGGRVRQNVRLEEARTRELLALYEQQVLRAVEEVETAMSDLAQERARQVKLAVAVSAAQRTMDMSLVLYRSGLTDFQNVLDAQRILIVQESDWIGSTGRTSANLVRLYKALGGGWQVAAPVPPGEGGASAPEEKP